MVLQSINPATEEVLATFEEFSSDQLDQVLDHATHVFEEWRRASFADRNRLMRGAAGHLRGRKERLAALITAEMGKPIVEAEAEIEKCAWNCDFYAENAEPFLAPQSVTSNAAESYVAFEPLGQLPGEFVERAVLDRRQGRRSRVAGGAERHDIGGRFHGRFRISWV